MKRDSRSPSPGGATDCRPRREPWFNRLAQQVAPAGRKNRYFLRPAVARLAHGSIPHGSRHGLQSYAAPRLRYACLQFPAHEHGAVAETFGELDDEGRLERGPVPEGEAEVTEA